MKELLSIKEKARAYDEAIEKLRKFYRDYDTVSCLIDVKEELANLFPELKESEDERIRKELIDFLEYYRLNNVLDSKTISLLTDSVAWLEKQGEQKTAENKGMNIVEEDMTPFQKKVFCIIDTAIEEEQGLKQVCDELLRLAHDEIIQKPAWSEEDEKMFEHIIAKATLHFSSINCLNEEEINFLKSLKDRVQPQSKQEWSEEDDQYLLVCKNALKKYQISDKWDAEIISHWLENKLKTPQSTWKPSDEQMKALDEALSLANNCGEEGAFDLSTLYKHLKKLREE